MANQPLKYQTNVVQKARPGKWVRFTDMYGSGLRRQSYDGRYVYETHYDKTGTSQPPSKDVKVWGSTITQLPVPNKPGSLADVMNQLAPDSTSTVKKVVGGVTAGRGVSGPALGIATTTGMVTPPNVLGPVVANVARAAGPLAIATGPALLITGILSALGKQPFKSPLAQPIFDAQGGVVYNSPPGNPGYKGGKYLGGLPVGETRVPGSELRGQEAKASRTIDVPESLRGNYSIEQKYKNGVYQLNTKLQRKFGVGVPQGTLYPNQTSVTRYSDEVHGSKPITYSNKGPEGEVVVKELAGGLGLTNLGRVLHGPRNKWGVPIDIGGEKTKAIRTSYLALRAYKASGGRLDPDEAIRIARERSSREVDQEIAAVKPKAVAWGRHDNPIDAKAGQLLMRAAEPKQAVWNQAENEWQDANLGLEVDQKAAWQRWEATRPVGHKNDKPNNRSVVNMASELASEPPAKTDTGAAHTKPLTKEDSPVSFTDERREAFAANRGNPAGTHKPKSTTGTSGSVLPHERGQGHKPLSSSSSNAATTKTTRITDDHWRSGGDGAHQPGNVIKPTNLGWGNAATVAKTQAAAPSTSKPPASYPDAFERAANIGQPEAAEFTDSTSPAFVSSPGGTADQIAASLEKQHSAPVISPEVAEAAGLASTAITDFSSPNDGPFPKLKPAPVSISKETAEAAELPDTDLVDKHYAITDVSSPTQIFEPPKAGAPPTEIFPIDPGQNIPRGKMGMY